MPRLLPMTTPPSRPDEWLTTEQAARYLGISVVTLLRWEAKDERLKARRTPGGHRRFSRTGLDAYIKASA